MKNKNKRFFFLGSVTLLAIFNYITVTYFINNEEQYIQVPITTSYIKANNSIQLNDFKMIKVPKRLVNIMNIYTEGKELVNRKTTIDLMKGSFFYKEIGNESTNSLPEVLVSIELSNSDQALFQVQKTPIVHLFFNHQEGNKSIYYGLLSEQVKVVSLSNEQNKNYLIVSIPIVDADYVRKAMNLGEIIPVFTNGESISTFYDISKTKQYINALGGS